MVPLVAAWDRLAAKLRARRPRGPVAQVRSPRLEPLEERTLLSAGPLLGQFDAPAKAPGEIRGSKFSDLDANGKWDDGEPGLAGWTIYADENGNGLWDLDEPYNITNAQGDYVLRNLDPGTYVVREVAQDGWRQTYPDPYGKQDDLLSVSGASKGTVPFSLRENRDSPQVATSVSNDEPFSRRPEVGEDAGSDFDDLLASESDALVCVDPPPDPARSGSKGTNAASPKAPYPLSETFQLHSRPTASKVIYLDFDGHTTSATLWNLLYTLGTDIDTPPYDLDGDASFSNAELEEIQKIWERVVEDFVPFDVDVTTEDPGSEALSKDGGSDERWGIRVCIGGSDMDWFGSPAAGVALTGTFTQDSDTPAYVFLTGEAWTAEAISHEVGHTLGLSHDGTSTLEYYEGHGYGPTGWAPIMGAAYYKQLVQWSKGEYPDANQRENDLHIITHDNGFGYRPDDHASSRSGATQLLPGPVGDVSAEGIVERNTDVDYFSFTTGSGTVGFEIDPFYRSPNLDVLARLYDRSGNLVASSNPTSELDARFDLVLPGGTYYLSIEGTGKGNPGNGYSDYGSLGYYSIDGTLADRQVGAYSISVGSGAVVEEVHFGNHLDLIDFGDAPDPSYATLKDSQGARHLIVTDGPRLGSRVDAELNGQSDPNALGDDTADEDDEDGVTFAAGIKAGETAGVDVDLESSPAAGRLNAWVDFNQDGDWRDPQEQIFDDLMLSAGAVHSLTFPVPEAARGGTTFARFRISTFGGLSYYGLAEDGEVEDYALTIEGLPGAAVTGRYLFYDNSAFDTPATDSYGRTEGDSTIFAARKSGQSPSGAKTDVEGNHDGVPDLVIAPDGAWIDTDGVALGGLMVESAAGILTGQAPHDLGGWLDDTDTRISIFFTTPLSGVHLLGDVIGDEFAGVNLYDDLTFLYLPEGTAYFQNGTLIRYLADDYAVAADKQPLLPGQTATFDNYTSYSRGINGLMIDLSHLPDGAEPDADDFEFRVGNDNDPGSWDPAPTPSSLTVRPTPGVADAKRVTIAWADYAIKNRWLQVTVLATANNGLAEPDVFYFGNAVGESGHSAGDARVNAVDVLLTRNNPRTFLDPAPIDFPYDHNRDGRANATDLLLARENQTHWLSALKLIAVPGGKSAAESPDAEGLSLESIWLFDLEPSSAKKQPSTEAVLFEDEFRLG